MHQTQLSCYKSKTNNTVNLTIKLVSFEALLSFLDNIKLPDKITEAQKNPSYIPYVIASTITDSVHKIKPELRERTMTKFTTNLALGIGLITSALVSTGFDGVNYFINFSLSLVKTTATTLIIDKLNKLKTIDGLSVVLFLQFIMQVPGIIMDAASSGLIMTLLCIASMALMLKFNHKILKSTESIDVYVTGRREKLEVSGKNYYITSLLLSNFMSGLITNNIIVSCGIMLILNPIITYLLHSNFTEIEEMDKYLNQNEIYISNFKHGSETQQVVNRLIKQNSLKTGVIGAVIFIVSSLLIKSFALSISPILLATAVNSSINVQFSAKCLIKQNNLKSFINIRQLKKVR